MLEADWPALERARVSHEKCISPDPTDFTLYILVLGGPAARCCEAPLALGKCAWRRIVMRASAAGGVSPHRGAVIVMICACVCYLSPSKLNIQVCLTINRAVGRRVGRPSVLPTLSLYKDGTYTRSPPHDS